MLAPMLEPLLDPSLLAPETVRPLGAHEYQQLVDAGVFADEHVELLAGLLVAMSPQGDVHANVTAALIRRLTLALGESHHVRGHSPFRIGTQSIPEPDVAVVPVAPLDAQTPTIALLIVELADSSLRKDRQVKAALYAAAGVPEYWIVDLNARAVEVHTDPTPDGYQSCRVHVSGDVLRPIELPAVAVAVVEILLP